MNFLKKNCDMVVFHYFIWIAWRAASPSNEILIEFNKYIVVSYIRLRLIALTVLFASLLLNTMLKTPTPNTAPFSAMCIF